MERQLDRLVIHRFRGLRELELTGLGAVNLLVGGNNSGKTTILEAVSTFCRPFDIREWMRCASRRSRSWSVLEDDQLRWLFAQDGPADDGNRTGTNSIEGDGRFPVREVMATYRAMTGVFNRTISLGFDDEGNEIEAEEAIEEMGAELTVHSKMQGLQVQERFTFWEHERQIAGPKGALLPTRTIAPFSHLTEQMQISALSEATAEGWKRQVVELLNRIDPTITGLDILSPSGLRPQFAVTHAEWGNMPLSAFGDGVRRIVFFALNLPAVRDGVLLIDEIENAIHVNALSVVFSWLVDACREYNVQLFATTHSLEAVDAMINVHDAESDVVAFRLEKAPAGPVSAQRFSGRMLQHLRNDLGLDIRWRSSVR